MRTPGHAHSTNGGIYQYAAVTAGGAYTASSWFIKSSTDAMELAETDDRRASTRFRLRAYSRDPNRSKFTQLRSLAVTPPSQYAQCAEG